jgi:hypothetical protein
MNHSRAQYTGEVMQCCRNVQWSHSTADGKRFWRSWNSAMDVSVPLRSHTNGRFRVCKKKNYAWGCNYRGSIGVTRVRRSIVHNVWPITFVISRCDIGFNFNCRAGSHMFRRAAKGDENNSTLAISSSFRLIEPKILEKHLLRFKINDQLGFVTQDSLENGPLGCLTFSYDLNSSHQIYRSMKSASDVSDRRLCQ